MSSWDVASPREMTAVALPIEDMSDLNNDSEWLEEFFSPSIHANISSLPRPNGMGGPAKNMPHKDFANRCREIFSLNLSILSEKKRQK